MKARRVVLSSKTTHIGRVRKHSSGRRTESAHWGTSRSITGNTYGLKRPMARTRTRRDTFIVLFDTRTEKRKKFIRKGAWYKYEPGRGPRSRRDFSSLDLHASRLNHNFKDSGRFSISIIIWTRNNTRTGIYYLLTTVTYVEQFHSFW